MLIKNDDKTMQATIENILIAFGRRKRKGKKKKRNFPKFSTDFLKLFYMMLFFSHTLTIAAQKKATLCYLPSAFNSLFECKRQAQLVTS